MPGQLYPVTEKGAHQTMNEMVSPSIPKAKATDLPLDLPGEKSSWTSGNEMLL